MRELVNFLAQDALRHLVPKEWDDFAWGLKEKRARLIGIRPEINGPVEFEGLLCSAKSGGEYTVTPVLSHSHDFVARTLKGGEVRRIEGGFCFDEGLYPSLAEAGLIDRITLKPAEPAGSSVRTFFLPTPVLQEYFSGRGLNLLDFEELARRQKQLKLLKGLVEI